MAIDDHWDETYEEPYELVEVETRSGETNVPEAYVELNRVDAQELGLKKGDRARVVSRRGSIEVPVEVDGRGKPPRGTVFVPFFDEHHLINKLTLDAMDNISKEPDYKKCAVRVEVA